jgi:hypothetical protein
MSNLSGRAFTGSNRSQMGSNVFTTQQQGGGSKKAGFPYQVGRDSWTSIALENCNPLSKTKCTKLSCLQFTTRPKASISRPIGSNRASNVYFNII